MENTLEDGGIAYCIPTFNHPEVMMDILSNGVLLYQKYNIDIYIYDSSTDNRTYEIVEYLIAQGIHNLYYVKIDPSVSVDNKLLMIFSGYELKKNYKYIWPVKDRVFVGEHTLKLISELLHKEYDVLFLILMLHPLFEEECLSTPIFYDDPIEFYGTWGWFATSLDTTIFRVESLLKNFDSEKFKQRYFFQGLNGFDHFTVLFHSLAMQDKCSVKLIPYQDIMCYSSPFGASSWTENIFLVWADCWTKTNDALPAIYDKYKNQTIKRATMLPWIFGSYDNLILLRVNGILTPDIYKQIHQTWGRLSDIPLEDLELIVYEQYDRLHDIVVNRLKRLLVAGNYMEADLLHKINQQLLTSLNGKKEYFLIREFLEIYALEKHSDVETDIFAGVSDYSEIKQKYVTLKFMLRRLEYNIAENTFCEMAEFIKNNNISNTFIAYLVNKTCIDKEQTVDKLLKIYKG